MLCTGKIEVTAELKENIRADRHYRKDCWDDGYTNENLENKINASKVGDVIFTLNNYEYVERNELKQQMMDGLVVDNLKLSSDGKIIKNKAYENIENYIKEKITHDGFRYDYDMQDISNTNYRLWGKEIQAYYEMRYTQNEYIDDYNIGGELETIANYVTRELENNGHKVYRANYICDNDVFFEIYATSLNRVIKDLQGYMSEFTCGRLTEEYKMSYKRMTTPKDVYDVVCSLEYDSSCDYYYGVIHVNDTFKEELAKVEKTYTVDDELAKIDLILKAVEENDKREGIKNEHKNEETMLIVNEICTDYDYKSYLDNNKLLALMRTAQLLAKKDKANVVRLDLHRLWLVPLKICFDFKNNIMAKASRYTQDDFKQREIDMQRNKNSEG